MTKSQFCLCRKTFLSLLFALICLPVAGLAQSDGQKKERDALTRVAFKGVQVKNVLMIFGKQMEMEVVIDDSVPNSKVNIELADVTLKAAIKAILAQQHLQARLLEDKKIVVFADDETNQPRFNQYKVWPEAAFA
nr:hypothetical protein [Acidobacteriota bacterium]